MSRKPLVLGVDGGGTKSIGLVADLSGNILTRREGGPASINVVGLDEAAHNLHRLISDCCDDTRCSPEELASAVLALAGAGDEAVRERIAQAVNQKFEGENRKQTAISVQTDSRAALEGAFNGGSGVVIIAGTGSIVMGKTDRRELLSVGGWGRFLGDEGSGYHIGREGLRAVSFHMDHRGEATRLEAKLADAFQWHSRADIIRGVYQEKVELSRVAPLVIEAAAENDIVCQKILQNAALLLAEQARVIVMQMGILRKIGLVMIGGLIDHENVYSNTLHMKLMKLLPQVEVRQPLHPPEHGAVLLALEQVRKP